MGGKSFLVKTDENKEKSNEKECLGGFKKGPVALQRDPIVWSKDSERYQEMSLGVPNNNLSLGLPL